MHVVHLIQYLGIGGLERTVQLLAATHREMGIRSTVVAYLQDGPLRAELEAEQTPVVFLPGRAQGMRWSLPRQIRKLIRELDADVLHTHHLGPFIYGHRAARWVGIPHVHTEHSHELYDRWRRRVVGRAMSRVARVVAVSNEIARWRSEHLGGESHVIPNGVPVPLPAIPPVRQRVRNELGLRPWDTAFGCVARLSPEKGHRTLLEAFARVYEACPWVQLVVVGDGAERAELARLVDELGVSSRIRWTGQVRDVRRVLSGLDACVLASDREGLPLALLEGMAAGLPAVVTAVGEMPAAVGDGAGLIVPRRDPGALAGAMRELAEDPALRRSMGRIGRQRVETMYGIQTAAHKYAELYRGLVDPELRAAS